MTLQSYEQFTNDKLVRHIFFKMPNPKLKEKWILQFFTKKSDQNNSKELSISNFIEKKLANCCMPENVDAEIENIPSNIDVVNELKVEKEKNDKLTNDLNKSVDMIKEISKVNLSKDLQI